MACALPGRRREWSNRRVSACPSRALADREGEPSAGDDDHDQRQSAITREDVAVVEALELDRQHDAGVKPLDRPVCRADLFSAQRGPAPARPGKDVEQAVAHVHHKAARDGDANDREQPNRIVNNRELHAQAHLPILRSSGSMSVMKPAKATIAFDGLNRIGNLWTITWAGPRLGTSSEVRARAVPSGRRRASASRALRVRQKSSGHRSSWRLPMASR
jgi:hypothetical protein